jgi:hypothetical protein
MDEGELLVSFDVLSLFKKVPIDEAMDIITSKYNIPDFMIKLSRHCMSSIYFIHEGKYHKQMEGAPIGSPLL